MSDQQTYVSKIQSLYDDLKSIISTGLTLKPNQFTVLIGAENSTTDGLPRAVTARFFMPRLCLGVREIRPSTNKRAVSVDCFQLPGASSEKAAACFLMKKTTGGSP